MRISADRLTYMYIVATYLIDDTSRSRTVQFDNAIKLTACSVERRAIEFKPTGMQTQ